LIKNIIILYQIENRYLDIDNYYSNSLNQTLSNFKPNDNNKRNKLKNFYVYYLDLTNCISNNSFFISLSKPADYFGRVSKHSEYFFKSHIFIGKILGNDIEYIDDSYSNNYSSEVEIKNIQAGKYIIFCHLDLEERDDRISNSNNKSSKKTLAILKVYSDQEFYFVQRLTTQDIDFHQTFDYLIYSLYIKKYSQTQKNKKFLLEKDSSIYYSQFRINKYSNFIIYVFKNDKPDSNFLIEFKIKSSNGIFLSNFSEFNEKENKFVKIIPYNFTFLISLYASNLIHSIRNKIIYSEEELKSLCIKNGKVNKMNDVIYHVLMKDGQVCFYFVNGSIYNYLLIVDINNFNDFEGMNLNKKSLKVYLFTRSNEFLILEYKNRLRFDDSISNSISYGLTFEKI